MFQAGQPESGRVMTLTESAMVNGMSANSEAAIPRRRGPGRPWQPGQSGNPTGLPREIPAAVAECRRLALAHVPTAILRLADLLDSEDERVRVAAATAIMDRAGVGPRSWEPDRLEVVATVDPDVLRAVLAQRVAALAAAVAGDVHELGAHAPDAHHEARALPAAGRAPSDERAAPQAIPADAGGDP